MRISNSIVLFAAATACAAQAKQVVHDWDIAYLTTSRGLDQAPKRGITVNGKFPLPVVEAEIGDLLILNVHNSLDPRQTGLPLDPPPHGLVNGFNGNQTKPIRFEPGKTYRIRLVPMTGFPAMEFSIDDHELILYEIDGARTKPKALRTIRMTPGERASVLVKAKETKDRNYSYHISMVTPRAPYDAKAPLVPTTQILSEEFDELTTESLDYLPALKPDRSFRNATLGYTQLLLSTILLISLNTATQGPSNFQCLDHGEMAKNPLIYGPQTNTEVFQLDEVIERGQVNDTAGTTRRTVPSHGFSPLLRDTVFVTPFTYVVIRFRADNPGAWLFHCHLDWHTPNLRSVFVTAPDVMQRTLKVPQSVLTSAASRYSN
ncbi:Cupredoxin [Linderina pennispora]|uniref:Cupredoxin n=1 Tax=Linderina pennispora TaxID=61395 RepID=A0A1Y1VSW6_9FUNG|nr:Cupredoxin [Linderina pennispora]ORX64106.1 Cupredoxin [Linderina pennispora]